MQYDSKIIETFADKLYARAKSIIITYTVAGLLIGAVGGTMVLHIIGTVIGALLVAAIGFSVGRDKAFHLKLEAQIALCQVQIEKNTRGELPMPMFTETR